MIVNLPSPDWVDTMVVSMESKYRKETHIKESIERSRKGKKEIWIGNISCPDIMHGATGWLADDGNKPELGLWDHNFLTIWPQSDKLPITLDLSFLIYAMGIK